MLVTSMRISSLLGSHVQDSHDSTSWLVISCQFIFTETIAHCKCCHGMTKDIFPLIPLSHKGSTEEREEGCMVWEGGVVSPPEEAELHGPANHEVCAVRHGVWKLRKNRDRLLLKQSWYQYIDMKKPLLCFSFHFSNFRLFQVRALNVTGL